MEKRHRTDTALDDALDALLAGDKPSLLRALRIIENHPRAEELRHLLTSAIETREAIRATPSDQARVRHLRMIGIACREQERSRAARKARDLRRMRSLVFRPVAIAGASLGLMIPGTLALASTAQPGQALYGTKLTVEKVQLALTTSPEAEIALHLKFAERRMDEVERLERTGGDVGPAVKTAVSNLESHTTAVKEAVAAMGNDTPPPAALTMALERHLSGINQLAGQTGCNRSGSGVGCAELRSALDTSVLALRELRKESPSGESAIAKGPETPVGGSTPDKPKTDKASGTSPQSPETSPASPTAAASEAAPSESASPSESPSQATGTATDPSPDPSPSPSPDPSASPSGDPAQSPAPSDQPTTTGSTDVPGGQSDPGSPVEDIAPSVGTIEPHSAG